MVFWCTPTDILYYFLFLFIPRFWVTLHKETLHSVSLSSCLFHVPRYPHLHSFPSKKHVSPEIIGQHLMLHMWYPNYTVLPIVCVYVYQSCIFCGIYFLRTTRVESKLLMFALSHGFQYLENMNSQWLTTFQQIWLHQIEEEKPIHFWSFKMESRVIKR
jgi:hypothetical protein